MSNEEIFIAYVLDKTDFGTQLLRYAFKHPIVEFWGEPEEQAKLIAYFKENHYSHDTPIIIEKSDLLDFMEYKPTATKEAE